jgi:hypothetical protein
VPSIKADYVHTVKFECTTFPSWTPTELGQYHITIQTYGSSHSIKLSTPFPTSQIFTIFSPARSSNRFFH